MRGGGSRIPLVLSGLGVFVLVGMVAVASTGSSPTGSADTRRPADTLLDAFFSLALLALVPAAGLFVYGLMQRREIAREIASGKYRRTGVVTYLVFILLFTLIVYFRLRNWHPVFSGRENELVDPGKVKPAGAPSVDAGGDAYRADFAWIPVLVVLGLAALGVVAYALAARRRRSSLELEEEGVVEHLADVLDDTLDDLRNEADPRRAVIAAYARLERALAAAGLPRRRQETAEEYVTRILARLEVDAEPVRALTALFARAKFSQHDVDETMKLAAIDALERIRDELRAAAQRATAAEPQLAEPRAATP